MTKKNTDYGAEAETQAEVEPLVVNPADWDPRKAGFGTPIGKPQDGTDYPKEGVPYPPPTP